MIPRLRSQVEAERWNAVAGGCCERFADQKTCSCLRLALPDTRICQAYVSDDTVRLLVDEWVDQRRCPAPLVDRCLELGLDAAADCARWASDPVRTPDVAVFEPQATEHGERGGKCGPYPACNCTDEPQWCWCPNLEYGARQTYAFDVPRTVPLPNRHGPTPLHAILALLDVWPENAADGGADADGYKLNPGGQRA